MEVLARDGVFEAAEGAAERLESGLNRLVSALSIDAHVCRVGTMLTLFFGDKAPQNFAEVQRCDHERFGRFHRDMLNEGVYLPPSGYEAWFVSAAHTDDDVDRTLVAAEAALSREQPGPH